MNLNWIKSLFQRKPKFKRVDLRFVPYGVAENLLQENVGWRVASKEEDRNGILGWVYLERVEEVKRVRQ